MSRRIARRSIQAAVVVFVLALAGPAAAEEYNSDRAGHPVRIIAYFVHPVGVFFDYAVLRPCHWVGSHEPFSTIFGHTEDEW